MDITTRPAAGVQTATSPAALWEADWGWEWRARLSQSSPYVGMAFGYYGLAWSVLARGGEVQFEKNALMDVKFGAAACIALPAALRQQLIGRPQKRGNAKLALFAVVSAENAMWSPATETALVVPGNFTAHSASHRRPPGSCFTGFGSPCRIRSPVEDSVERLRLMKLSSAARRGTCTRIASRVQKEGP